MNVWQYPSITPVYELDALVLVMVVLTLIHAHNEASRVKRLENYVFVLTSFLLGLVTEHASIRFGGTHCHASSSILNFSECSSVNSVMYYVPWVYCCLRSAKRISSGIPFTFMTGLLFYGMCGVYEMQGPLMGWWLWPQADGVVKPGTDIWQHGDPGKDTRGMVTTRHVAQALGERVFGFPILAPYFHSAFGWGIALSLLWTVPSFSGNIGNKSTKKSFFSIMGGYYALMGSVILGPSLAMFWDPLVRVSKAAFGADYTCSAPVVMMLSYLVPIILSSPKNAPYESPRDLILFLVPLLNALYFNANCLFRGGRQIIPGNLKLWVLGVSLISLTLHAKASGMMSNSFPGFSAVLAPLFKGKISQGSAPSNEGSQPTYSSYTNRKSPRTSSRGASRRKK